MLKENRRRLAWQLGFAVVFFSASSFTFIVQSYNLPPPDPNPVTAMMNEKFKPDPWTYHPMEYNPFNNRETLVEACVIWIGFFYGFIRFFNIFRIIRDDEKASDWEHFWGLCDDYVELFS